jgi:hypothetical protein
MVAGQHHVYVPLIRDEDGYPPVDAEEIDATKVSSGQFRVESVPVFAYGLARGDVVRAARSGSDDRLWVTEVLISSPNWVARVIPRGDFDTATIVRRFQELGCRAHATRYGLVAIDVPPEAIASSVLDQLAEGQDIAQSWYYDLGVSPEA